MKNSTFSENELEITLRVRYRTRLGETGSSREEGEIASLVESAVFKRCPSCVVFQAESPQTRLLNHVVVWDHYDLDKDKTCTEDEHYRQEAGGACQCGEFPAIESDPRPVKP